MTTREWARKYPEIATALFRCSVDDLDNIIQEEEKRFKSEEGEYYLKRTDINKLTEILNVVMCDCSTNEYTFNARNLIKEDF